MNNFDRYAQGGQQDTQRDQPQGNYQQEQSQESQQQGGQQGQQGQQAQKKPPVANQQNTSSQGQKDSQRDQPQGDYQQE